MRGVVSPGVARPADMIGRAAPVDQEQHSGGRIAAQVGAEHGQSCATISLPAVRLRILPFFGQLQRHGAIAAPLPLLCFSVEQPAILRRLQS